MLGEFCYRELHLDDAVHSGLFEEIDPKEQYLKSLAEKVDFAAIARLGTIALNPLYGTGRGYLEEPLLAHGGRVHLVNAHRRPLFRRISSRACREVYQDFIGIVKQDPAIKLGLATDGDADRFGIVDEDGTYIEPNYVIALLLDYLVRMRGMTGGVARSVATSHFVDAVARKHGIEVYETPVGFKYVGELISQDKIVIGGEESAGLSIKGHVPEKDGILACFLVAEMVARESMSVKALLERLYGQVGRYVTKRENITLCPEGEETFPDKLRSVPGAFAGSRVKEAGDHRRQQVYPGRRQLAPFPQVGYGAGGASVWRGFQSGTSDGADEGGTGVHPRIICVPCF